MAGYARPNDNILVGSKIECTDYEILPEYSCAGGSPQGLFDGKTPNSWTTGSCDISYSLNFFIIRFNYCVNIYRSGTIGWSGCIAPSIIYKLNETTYVYEDITSMITQNLTSIINSQWELYIEDLPPGTYKFQGVGSCRVDSEWFLEIAPSHILKSNSKYYSVKPEYYNSETRMYEPIEINDLNSGRFLVDDMFTDVTIAGETFKPVDKFEKFSVVSVWGKLPLKVYGTKTDCTMITGKGDIDISIAETIHEFTLKSNQTNSIIRLAISVDKGKTWCTCSNSNLVPLDIIIPLKNNSNMNQEEIQQYENAKRVILENGIDKSVFSKQDFNALFNGYKSIRFAYVLKLNDSNSLAELDSLQWNFDAVGSMHKMSDEEVQIDIYEHSVLVTSLIDTDIVKANMII